MSHSATIIRRRRRRLERRAVAQSRRSAWGGFFGALLLIGVVLPGGVVLGGTAIIYSDAASRLPTPQDAPAPTANASRFFDSTGTVEVYTVRDPAADRRAWVTLDSLPSYVVDATLTVEDPDFWTATGANPLDTLVRLWHNLLVGTPPPDPSITGRLVRNIAVGGSIALPGMEADAWWTTLLDARTVSAAREIALVAEANQRYTPAELLTWHLNTNYYGSEAYGIEAAAQIYFGKPAADLTLDEAALLASIPTAPQYNPFDNPVASRGRQRDTLRALYAAGLITQSEFEVASARETPLLPGAVRSGTAADYAEYALRQAEGILDQMGMDGAQAIRRGGLRVILALDVDAQRQAECLLAEALARVNPLAPRADDCPAAVYLPPPDPRPALEMPIGEALAPDTGAVVVIDPRTGELRAMVGSVDAVAYQPGMTLSPFVYLAGFSQGMTPATMVFDVPAQFPGAQEGLLYTVRNPDGQFRGPVSLREAMGAGLLPPTAAIANRQGISSILTTAHLLGVNSMSENAGDAPADLMLLERGGRVAPLDMAYAYSVFAGMGKMRGVEIEPLARGFRARDPVAVRRIETPDGTILWEYDPADAAECRTLRFCTNLLQDGLAYLINDILADESARREALGQGNALELSRPGAVVNSITSDRADNWTIGYTPQLLTAVHLGHSAGSAVALDPYGMNGAAAVWRGLMEYLHARDALPVTGWTRPDSVIESVVCERSGLYPNSICPVRQEWFVEGTQPRPTQVDGYWQEFEINRQTRQLATANTPPELRTTERYFVPPQEVLAWWRETGQPLPPTEIDTISSPDRLSATRISAPQPFAYVGGVVEVLGAVDPANLQFFQLAYGAGLNPSDWVDISGQQTATRPDTPLAVWDTSRLDGLYSLRLTVVRADNQVERLVVQVTVDNQPPRISLMTEPPGRLYRFPGDAEIALVAQVADNLTVDRVEFFHNGAFLGSDERAPYGFEFAISQVGRQTFSAVAFDTVGNQVSSDLAVEVIRAGS